MTTAMLYATTSALAIVAGDKAEMCSGAEECAATSDETLKYVLLSVLWVRATFTGLQIFQNGQRLELATRSSRKSFGPKV
jgi:hypothetical protein